MYSRVFINIYEKDTMPIYDCLVAFRNNKRLYKCYTDKCGIASFYLPYGKYILTIKKDDYYKEERKVIIKNKLYIKRIKVKITNNNMIYGQVLDKYKRPINKAPVVLFRQYPYISMPIDFTETDLLGFYRFKGISQGTYYVKVCKTGQVK